MYETEVYYVKYTKAIINLCAGEIGISFSADFCLCENSRIFFTYRVLERLVDFLKYFSADFSLCENKRIFFSYLVLERLVDFLKYFSANFLCLHNIETWA
jgi:hypothetical protein